MTLLSFARLRGGNEGNVEPGFEAVKSLLSSVSSIQAVPANLRTLLTEGALRRLAVPNVERLTAGRYRIYSQMCLAKHNNAVMLGQHVVHRDAGGDVSLLVGPDYSDRSLQTATFVLVQGIALAHLAVEALLQDYAGTEAAKPLRERLKPLRPHRGVDGRVAIHSRASGGQRGSDGAEKQTPRRALHRPPRRRFVG